MQLLQQISAVDLVLGTAMVLAVFSGYRIGGRAAILQILFVIGALIGSFSFAPYLMVMVSAPALRWLIALSVVLFTAGIASVVATHVGNWWRSRMKHASTVRVDKAVGAFLMPIGVLVFSYLLITPLVGVVGGQFPHTIRESKLIGAVHAALGTHTSAIDDDFAALLSDSLLTPPKDPYLVVSAADLPPLDTTHFDQNLVNRLRPSVVQVVAASARCTHGMRGSGFVIAPGYVMTNAHVVAGTDQVVLDTVLGSQPAHVVLYDPAEDTAVLYSPGLELPALTWSEDTPAFADEVLVMGHPDGGPFVASAARIKNLRVTSGSDIYGHPTTRMIYTIDGDIRHGNSGGPMIAADGTVLGVVFADEINNDLEGYVLDGREVRDRIGDVTALTLPASTGECLGATRATQ